MCEISAPAAGTSSEPAQPGAAWLERAEDLARWAMLRLVNRTDRCGGYWTGPEGTQPTSRPAKGAESGFLTHNKLVRHFRATEAVHVVGTYALGPDSTGKWCGVDIDAHPGTTADPAANERFAMGVYAELAGLGFRPLLYESNGKGGYHVRALSADAVAGGVLFAFGRWLVRAFQDHGFARPPETFPKQPRLDDETRFGNWLRLPGRHHKRDFWPRVWDGVSWLDGPAAVRHVLSLTGDPAELIPAAAVEYEPADWRKPGRVVGLPPVRPAGQVGDRPGDQFNARIGWDAILTRHGWRPTSRSGDAVYWTRPNKTSGISASTGFCSGDQSGDLFYVWTSSAPPFEPGVAYSKFAAYSLLEHRGDFISAARALGRAGYGNPPSRAKAKGVRK
jgi:hypothetical protein